MFENEIKLTNREKKIEKQKNKVKKHGKNIGVIYMNALLKRNKGDKYNAS